MTLKEIIKEYKNIFIKKGINNPLYFVAKVISEIENINLSNILIEKDFIISENTLNKLKKIILDDYPLEYITNKVIFYNYGFYVDNNVLIPRIETEDLINIAKDIIIKNNYKYIMDIGTGSGVIAIILKKIFSDSTIYGVDISKEALEVAEKNAKNHNVNIKFIQSDIFENVPNNILNNIEFIVSNPPYVEKDFFDKNSALKYEPKIALEAGEDGQDFFYKLSNNYPEILKSKHFLFETTEFNIDKTVKILSKFGIIKVYKDSFGVKRFVEKLPNK
ncbi:N5-glutamine methyltransferase family protein [Marinitoga aeolica]|uniref:peptide chain release factor N(5)-glutamine methyltransferase n=1 Tax=Marinitoga aeolica TaxID=2809031 RepID=A0ABY8PP79_9BACT|nr:HemK/PrmC family methyltransferase [Marinitoga aeolica]WGS64447.1 peptide chain release factor N(5)-glutamine methyltransferase [Marinitoga aeolica]